MAEKLSIKDYFRGKNIFITGGTGFVGKALIEKLLRSCPDLNKIYILVRPKQERAIHERVKEIWSSPLFDLLKKEAPENIKKIIPIAGDIKELGLGVSDEDKQILKEEINIFFHAAASVRFDDFLRDAIFTNLRSAREAAALALEMKRLDVFTHVSTTYCNIDNKQKVEEIMYPAHGDWKEIITIAETCNPNIFNVLSKKFIGVFPNTYTYTKQLAEHCINDLLVGNISTIIYRPSIVIGTVTDPYQGWIDNLNGPNGLMLGVGSGLLRIVHSDPTISTDYIPVDIVVKSMIVAAWSKVNFGNKDSLDIYHGSSYGYLSIGIKEQLEMGKKITWDIPLKNTIWYPSCEMTKCWYYYYINIILFQVIPALFLDFAIRIAGHSPLIFKLQKKIFIVTTVLEPFTTIKWDFLNTRFIELENEIPKKEQHEFNYIYVAASKKTMYEYFSSCVLYCKVNLLKEEAVITDKLRSRHLRMYCLYLVCHWTFYMLVIWMLFFKMNVVENIFGYLYNYFYNL